MNTSAGGMWHYASSAEEKTRYGSTSHTHRLYWRLTHHDFQKERPFFIYYLHIGEKPGKCYDAPTEDLAPMRDVRC